MIDRYLLRYFLAVIDHGNFSKAASQCNVSQPTLSIGIAKLERALEQPLFHRTNRRVELTEAGARLAVHARRIESDFIQFERSAADTPSRRLTRIGVLTTIPWPWMMRFAEAYVRLNADEQIELIEGRERDLAERLDRGRIDVALTIIRGDEHRFESELLATEGYSLAIPSNHPCAQETTISAEMLAENIMIVRRHCEVLAETSRHFTRRGVRPFFVARTTNDDRALSLVAAGMGVTVMPDGFTAPGVLRPRLAGFDFKRNLGLLYGSNFNRSGDTASAAINLLREMTRDLAVANQTNHLDSAL